MPTIKSHAGASFRSIIHPTDFSHGSDVAFAHALRMTLCDKGDLEVLHVDRGRKRADWNDYPSVRSVLSAWGILPPDAGRRDVARLGVNISKSACTGRETATAVLDHINARDADLIVMATHQRDGLDRWMHRSLAEYVSNRTEAATLFIPYGVDGFVDLNRGTITLQRILIPIDRVPNPQIAVDAAGDLVRILGLESVEVQLLHVGDAAGMPSPKLPSVAECNWRWTTREGPVVETICSVASEENSDLVVMTTNGHDGFLDAIRGSTSERVLQQLKCPLLSVHECGS